MGIRSSSINMCEPDTTIGLFLADAENAMRPNNAMQLTKPGQLRSVAAYPEC